MCKNLFSYIANAPEMVGTVFHEKAMPVTYVAKIEQIIVFEKNNYNYKVKYMGYTKNLGLDECLIYDLIDGWVKLEDFGKNWTSSDAEELKVRKTVFKYIPEALDTSENSDIKTALYCGEVGETFEYLEDIKITLLESKIYSNDEEKYKNVVLE